MSDTLKTAKIIKRWYYSTAHWQLGDVMVNDITFLWFLLFSMCHSLHVAVNKCINWCFVHLSGYVSQKSGLALCSLINTLQNRSWADLPEWFRLLSNYVGRCYLAACTERCMAGQYFVRERGQCVDCPRGTYQRLAGQDFCVQCPADTTTDHLAAVCVTQCKSTLASHYTVSQ